MVFDYFSTKIGIEFILITILLLLFLKYEYFIHHYISFIIFFISSVSIDLLLNNYSLLSNKKFLEIFLNIICVITKVAYLCYIKYMIDKHYHYYWNIMFSLGIFKLILAFISTFTFVIIKSANNRSIYVVY